MRNRGPDFQPVAFALADLCARVVGLYLGEFGDDVLDRRPGSDDRYRGGFRGWRLSLPGGFASRTSMERSAAGMVRCARLWQHGQLANARRSLGKALWASWACPLLRRGGGLGDTAKTVPGLPLMRVNEFLGAVIQSQPRCARNMHRVPRIIFAGGIEAAIMTFPARIPMAGTSCPRAAGPYRPPRIMGAGHT